MKKTILSIVLTLFLFNVGTSQDLFHKKKTHATTAGMNLTVTLSRYNSTEDVVDKSFPKEEVGKNGESPIVFDEDKTVYYSIGVDVSEGKPKAVGEEVILTKLDADMNVIWKKRLLFDDSYMYYPVSIISDQNGVKILLGKVVDLGQELFKPVVVSCTHQGMITNSFEVNKVYSNLTRLVPLTQGPEVIEMGVEPIFHTVGYCFAGTAGLDIAITKLDLNGNQSYTRSHQPNTYLEGISVVDIEDFGYGLVYILLRGTKDHQLILTFNTTLNAAQNSTWNFRVIGEAVVNTYNNTTLQYMDGKGSEDVQFTAIRKSPKGGFILCAQDKQFPENSGSGDVNLLSFWKFSNIKMVDWIVSAEVDHSFANTPYVASNLSHNYMCNNFMVGENDQIYANRMTYLIPPNTGANNQATMLPELFKFANNSSELFGFNDVVLNKTTLFYPNLNTSTDGYGISSFKLYREFNFVRNPEGDMRFVLSNGWNQITDSINYYKVSKDLGNCSLVNGIFQKDISHSSNDIQLINGFSIVESNLSFVESRASSPRFEDDTWEEYVECEQSCGAPVILEEDLFICVNGEPVYEEVNGDIAYSNIIGYIFTPVDNETITELNGTGVTWSNGEVGTTCTLNAGEINNLFYFQDVSPYLLQSDYLNINGCPQSTIYSIYTNESDYNCLSLNPINANANGSVSFSFNNPCGLSIGSVYWDITNASGTAASSANHSFVENNLDEDDYEVHLRIENLENGCFVNLYGQFSIGDNGGGPTEVNRLGWNSEFSLLNVQEIKGANYTVEVYNMTTNTIAYIQKVEGASKEKETINLSHLAKGSYYVLLKQNGIILNTMPLIK